MNNLEFSERLRAYRKEKALSQKEFGELLGVSNKTVSKWENGESYPKTATMLKIAELIGIDGNELIGLGETGTAASEEFDALKSENAALKYKLNTIEKRKRKTLITAFIVAAVGIVVSVLLVFFLGGDADKYNNSITDAGKEGTKIVWSGNTYVPSDKYDNSYIDAAFSDRKYADYFSSDGKKQRALINCDTFSDCISIRVKGKSYYYINEKVKFPIEETTSDSSDISLSIIYLKAGSKATPNTESFLHDKSFIAQYTEGEEFIKLFVDFYINDKKEADKKITEVFLGNDAYIVNVSRKGENQQLYSADVGEFFRDDKGNTYYYDYDTTKAYKVGKELSDYVYK